MADPSVNGVNGNGRAPNGTFVVGNKGGPGGSQYALRVAEFRAALVDAVTPDDVAGIIRKLVEKAKAGDNFAARELLDRLLGKPDQSHKIVAAIGTNAFTPEQVAEVILAGRLALPPTE
jgi:hypothetical protein